MVEHTKTSPTQIALEKHNVNQWIYVKFTDYGLDVFEQMFFTTRMINFERKRYAGKYVKFQMWDFMNKFGQHFGLGCPNVIETNFYIKFTDDGPSYIDESDVA